MKEELVIKTQHIIIRIVLTTEFFYMTQTHKSSGIQVKKNPL